MSPLCLTHVFFNGQCAQCGAPQGMTSTYTDDVVAVMRDTIAAQRETIAAKNATIRELQEQILALEARLSSGPLPEGM